MMEGNSYSKESLIKAITMRFGDQERFYTCSRSDLTAEALVEFLEAKGKFKPTDGGFTVDVTRICNHEG